MYKKREKLEIQFGSSTKALYNLDGNSEPNKMFATCLIKVNTSHHLMN